MNLRVAIAPLVLLCAVTHEAAGHPHWPDPPAALQEYSLRGPEPVLPDPLQPLPGYLQWSDLYESDARAMRLNGDPGTLLCDDTDPDPSKQCFDPSLSGFVWPNMITPHYSLTSAVNADETIIALDNNEQCDAFGACVRVSGGFRSLYLAGPAHSEPLGRPLYMRFNHHGGRACEERWHPIDPLNRIQVCHDDTIQLLQVDLPEGSNQTEVVDLAALGFVDVELGGGQKGQPSVLAGDIKVPLRATREGLPSGGTYCLVYDISLGLQGQLLVTVTEHATWFWCGLEPGGRYLTVYETSSSPANPGALSSYDADAPAGLVSQIQVCEELSHFCYLAGPDPDNPAWAIGQRQFENDCLSKPPGDGPMIRGDLKTGSIVEVSPDVQASHSACMGDVMGPNPRKGWIIASQHSNQALVDVSVDESQLRRFIAWIRSLDFEAPHPFSGTDFEKNSEPQCTNAGKCQAICASNWGSTSSINSILFDWLEQCEGAEVPTLGGRALPVAIALFTIVGAWTTRHLARSLRS